MSKFKVDDAVFIAEGSQYYGSGDNCNPSCEGKVISIISEDDRDFDDFDVDVEWDNGATNCYRDKDLRYAKEPKVKVPAGYVYE